MSAWVVSKTHIDLMVRAAIEAGRDFDWHYPDDEGRVQGRRKVIEGSVMSPLPLDADLGPDAYTPSQLGQVFVNENLRSVGYRYSPKGRRWYYGDEHAAETEPTPDEELPGPNDRYYLAPYVYENPCYTLTLPELAKAIACYRYQSCEHEEWEQSEAATICDALLQAYVRKEVGYEAAPWGWEAEDLESKPKDRSVRLI